MAVRNALGIIELASIYKGYEVQDAILKATNVEKLVSRTICSGKYFILVRGDIADVEEATEISRETGGFAIVSAETIPNVDPRVFPAIAGCTLPQHGNGQEGAGALLIIETFSVASAIKAADYAVKEAELDVIRIHVAMAIGGKGLVILSGDIAALEAALVPAVEYCKREGMLAGYTLIRNPHKDVLKELI